MSRSSSRRARPASIGVLLFTLIAGWVYNRVVKNQVPPPETPRPAPRSTPRAPQAGKSAPEYSPPSSGQSPHEIEGQLQRDIVTKVYDGDTVTLQKAGSIRLIGVDCPEKSQDGGRDAATYAQNALMGKTVELELCAKQPTDRYGRGLGFIYLPDRTGRRVLFNAELVKAGYARVYSLRPCTVDEAVWNGYYEEARRQKRGLFATLGEVPDAASYRKSKRAR